VQGEGDTALRSGVLTGNLLSAPVCASQSGTHTQTPGLGRVTSLQGPKAKHVLTEDHTRRFPHVVSVRGP